MTNIKIMDEILANKIAAGEVVEKCVSIVKELVENSIDAKSKTIKIELLESGIREIKIIDDGVGMNEEDASLAFMRHATSKLYFEEDLYRINSLGFRGEALPSIASVSEITLKTSDTFVGTEINIKGGKIISKKRSDLRKGTSITVKNLFYNTPARLKHLSSLYSELASIVDFVNKIALSYPNISFVLKNDEKTILNTDGSNNQLKVINAIYGLDVTKKMIYISCEDDDYEVNGFISFPELTKSNRNHIITLVNNRVVKNLELNKTINDSYHTYKPEDRFPIVILNIKVDSSLIDVNIHPTKQDIKFSKMNELKELIKNKIESELNKKTLIPSIKKEEYKSEQNIEEISIDFGFLKESDYYEETKSIDELKTIERFPDLYPVGVVKGTYIVAQNENGMFLIDQHAAKERINYEYFLKKIGKSNDVVTSLFPVNIEMPYNEYIIIKENLSFLSDLGFLIEEFGSNTFVVREHPIWLPINYEEQSIKKIFDLVVVKEKEFDKEKFNEKIAITLSCKLSIKANENISLNEMEILLNDLKKTENPFTCPHGRPTVIFYSNYELEKLFKRAM